MKTATKASPGSARQRRAAGSVAGPTARASRQRALPIDSIARAIRQIRGRRVLLDSDLALLYGVPTKVLNQAVKRNAERFPEDFRFQLTLQEARASRSQDVTLKPGRGRNIKFLPQAFTEHGAVMAATVLSTPRAVQISIYVVRAFVHLRELHASNKALTGRLDQLEACINARLANHDDAIAAMLSAIRELMAAPAPSKRRGIGFTADLTAKP